jgi:protocatechuate 3,4-dioxygenase beta subunit
MAMMKTRVTPIALIFAALAALLLWRCHNQASSHSQAAPKSSAKSLPAGATMSTQQRPDPKTQPRGSIAGTITDEQKAPIAGARVCAELYSQQISAQDVRDPICTTADDKGRYALKNLYAGEYEVAASAKTFRPGSYHPDGPHDPKTFELKPSQDKTGVDIALRAGGVEITGVVSDVSGGPIAHALVTASSDWNGDLVPPVETDDNGAFSMWVKAGDVSVNASADGYAPGSDSGPAPGAFQILLTPESSLAGTVVDAKTGEPVPGVMVEAEGGEWGSFSFFGAGNRGQDTDVTDDKGAFRISRLDPGRYTVNATSAHGYGVSAGSTLVGLGQHVDGVIVKLHAGYRVSGWVLLPDKTRCKSPSLWLSDPKKGRSYGGIREPDNTLHADGVLPGTYEVHADCDDYQAKDKYEKIVVVDKDLENVVWEVDTGATVKGRVTTKAGAPVEGANVWARSTGGAARDKTGWGGSTSERDGTYSMKGMKAGSFKIEVNSDVGHGPRDGWTIDVAAGATVEKDLVLDDGGTVKGTVVDDKGKPVAGVHVQASSLTSGWEWGGTNARTKQDGTFTIENLRPGDYRVTAQRGFWQDELRKPGSTDDSKQGEKVTVSTTKIATVKLVVESQSGVIKGSVVDAAGQAVSDAFVVAARESDAAGAMGSSVQQTRWSWDDKPVLSNVDGTFTVARLSPGNYALRAYRKGGGEAVVEHVAVGSTTKLVIRATGGISGIVRKEGTPADQLEEVEIDLSDEKTGYSREESFFRTGGVFSLKDLPAGHFTLTASSATGKKQMTIDLAEGQQKDGIDLALEELVTLKGRVVDMQTKTPVPGMRMFASLAKGGGGMSFSSDEDQNNITDESGEFTIEDAPRGKLMIRGMPKNWRDGDYSWLTVVREVTQTGTVELGDIPILKKRIKDSETAGEIGLHFAEAPDGQEPEQHEYKVSYIDPQGPAAKLDIKVGDVVVTIDGIDVKGVNSSNGWTLMNAPVGTKLSLGLARGTTVTITLAAP